LAEAVRKTPKKWTGQTRKEWQVKKIKDAKYLVSNYSKVMLWLENGTGQSTGGFIYPKVAKALFVPLTKKAAFSDRRTFGVFGGNVAEEERGIIVKTGAYKERYSRRGIKKIFKTIKLIYGKDYVLAKRVRGIKAMKIAAGISARLPMKLLSRMKSYVRKVLSNKN
jgi:hypothetical protein